MLVCWIPRHGLADLQVTLICTQRVTHRKDLSPPLKILNLAALKGQREPEQIHVAELETLTIIFGGIKSSPSHAMASSSFSASQFKSKSPSKVPQES